MERYNQMLHDSNDTQSEIFEQVDELTGNNRTEDNVKNAVHAIITKSMDIDANFGGIYRKIGSYMIMNNVDAIARGYKDWKLTKQLKSAQAIRNANKN